MTAAVRSSIPRLTNRRAAADRRLQLVDEQSRQFAASIHARADGPERLTEVEVQSFAPDGNDTAIVGLSLHIAATSDSWTGSAEVQLSPAEARIISQTLIVAAFEAEGITERLRGPWLSGVPVTNSLDECACCQENASDPEHYHSDYCDPNFGEDDRPAIERYGTPEHEALLIAEERGGAW